MRAVDPAKSEASMVDHAMQNNVTTKGLRAINLSSLLHTQVNTLRSLQVSKSQDDFGGTFAETVEEWRANAGQSVLGLCFTTYNGAPVGIVLLKRPPASPDWTPPSAVSLHGLKIAHTFQGQGFGRKALELAIDEARMTWPDATTLILAADAGNSAALSLYRRFGMTDSGPIYHGRIGLEHRLELSLTR